MQVATQRRDKGADAGVLWFNWGGINVRAAKCKCKTENEIAFNLLPSDATVKINVPSLCDNTSRDVSTLCLRCELHIAASQHLPPYFQGSKSERNA